jgi:AcrR family transcriptional regulator
MGRVPAKEGHPKKRRAVRTGRPPRKLAGEVDARILDAARRLFLERGLEGTSVDEIASLARAGKPTIYARFPSKETLFSAVVLRIRRHISINDVGSAVLFFLVLHRALPDLQRMKLLLLWERVVGTEVGIRLVRLSPIFPMPQTSIFSTSRRNTVLGYER